MKSALRHAILLLIVVAAYQPAKAQTPEVAQLLHDVQARYASLQSEDCYVVKAHADHIDRTFWISKASKLIRQERTDSSGSSGTPELTDADARKVLESMGQKATDERIVTLRNELAHATQAMKSIRSGYSIERHREIKTNDPMSPADFLEKTGGE
jgi:hypothetical protein